MCNGRTAEWVSVVSNSEVLVMFVTVDGEGTARNVSVRHKILQSLKVGKRRNRKNCISVYLREFRQKNIN
jgi:hypothetical protein